MRALLLMAANCMAPGECATLYAMLLVASPEDAGTRLDRFLVEQLDDTSRSLVLQWVRGGEVQVDGAVERKAARKLRGGESITVEPPQRAPLRAEPEDIDLNILYEDDDLAVIDKPAGMTVHAGAGTSAGTLVNALLHHVGALSGVSGDLRPGIVHRLDRFTSGAIVVAKRDRAHRMLQEQFQRREVSKLYWAAVEGALPADPHDDAKLLRHGHPVMRDGVWWLRIEMPIRRDRRNRVKMAVAINGREAVSDVRRIRSGAAYSLAEVRIHTGRTHQVRVHLAAAGHPVVGDSLYGARQRPPELGEPGRYLLHARVLEFAHPASGERIRFEAPLPAAFEGQIARLRI